MRHGLPPLLLFLAVSACGLLGPKGERDGLFGPITGPSAPQPATASQPTDSTTALGARAVSAEVLDTTSVEEKTAALATPAATGERELGLVTVALGPPAEQGLWLKTTLVRQTAMGRVVTAGEQSLAVELRPGTGGALLSLAAFQALGLGLTDLPQLVVFGP